MRTTHSVNRHREPQHYDAIVVGSGIAGLSFACRLGQAGWRVAILTKKNCAESNTNYAQGGIACVMDPSDDFEKHVEDTLIAGDGLCRVEVVRSIIRNGPACIQDLIALGVAFSQQGDGRLSLGREGGHSQRRILHVADATGKAIEAALLRAVTACPHITLLEHHYAIDLITYRRLAQGENVPCEQDALLGLYALETKTGRIQPLRSTAILLATGGVGQVYRYTTNPGIATGDGIAMAYRGGLAIRNMEFIQFHPTTLYTQSGERFLISEAVRGEGAVLRNTAGRAFMQDYHERADLAPRDVVARSIDQEMKQSGAPHLWLDLSPCSVSSLQQRFPNIYAVCRQHGIDITRDAIPVVPAAHYLCGGIPTDLDGATALPGLYACGEVACTGLNGANRLASNSLLEAVVTARLAAKRVHCFLQERPPSTLPLPQWATVKVNGKDERVTLAHNREELKRTLWDYVGIVRTTNHLERAQRRIKTLADEVHEYYWSFPIDVDLLELRNLIQVADLIVRCALERCESRGLHYTLNYPEHQASALDTVCKAEVTSEGS